MENSRMCPDLKRLQTPHRGSYQAVALGTTLLFAALTSAQENDGSNTNEKQPEVVRAASAQMAIPPPADYPSAYEWTVTLYEVLASAGQSDLKVLMEESRDIDQRKLREDAQFAIASRFASVDPNEALEQTLLLPMHERAPFVEGIYAEWSESDLGVAILAAESLNRELRLVALEAITSTRDDLKVSDLRAIAKDLDHPYHAAHVETKTISNNLADDPVKAWNVLVQDGFGDVLHHYVLSREQDAPGDATQLDALIRLAETAVEQRGFEALFHLRAPTFNYESDFSASNKILSAAVERIVRNDPIGTWNYIQDGSPRMLSQLDGQTELASASAATRRDQLYMRDVVQELLLKSWAVVDPATILERIEQIPLRLQAMALEQALPAFAATEPERAIELTQEMKHLGANRWRTVWGTVEQWATADPSAALDWVMTSQDIEHGPVPPERLLRIVLYSLVLEDPERALMFAVQQPNTDRLDAYVISHLADFDLEAAVELLPLVKKGAYSVSIHWVAARLLKNGEVDRAISLYSNYEKSGGDVNWSMFCRRWQMENSVQLFEHLDELPPRVRYWGARTLIHYDDHRLTQAQMDYARVIRDEGEP